MTREKIGQRHDLLIVCLGGASLDGRDKARARSMCDAASKTVVGLMRDLRDEHSVR
jgi:hypothetical protein